MNKEFNSLKIVFRALLIGMIIFWSISLLLQNIKFISTVSASAIKTFQYISAVVVLSCVWSSIHVYKRKLERVKSIENFSEKIAAYRAAYIFKLALLEGAALFNIIISLITSDKFFSIGAALIIVLFALQFPSKQKAIIELNLNEMEAAQLD